MTNWGSIGAGTTCRDGSASGYVVEYGDLPTATAASRALPQTPLRSPSRVRLLLPPALDAQRGDGQATLTFTDADGNGSPITGYETS